MNKHYRISITLLEDLHTGTGTGNLIIDDTQAKDSKGHPVIDRHHFRGVLRYNALRLKELGVINEKQLEVLFGRSGEKQRQLDCTSLITDEKDCLTYWESSARQVNSRVPEDHSLRRIEFIKADTVLTGEISLKNVEDEHVKAFENILRFTTRLGSERTRGSGQIKIEFPQNKQTQNKSVAPLLANATKVRLLLVNKEPLCIPTSGHAGNIIRSESYIPGRTLFAALCAKAATVSDEALKSLFTDKLSIGNAYPIPEVVAKQNIRKVFCLPMPNNIYTIKQSASPTAKQDHWPHWAKPANESAPELHPDNDVDKESAPKLRSNNEVDNFTYDGKDTVKRPKGELYLIRDENGDWRRYRQPLMIRMRNRRGDPCKACDFRMMSVSNANEQQKTIQEFQSEFKSKKKECAMLIVNSTSIPDEWTIAGFNDEGLFKSVLIDDPSSELSVELNKKPANKSKIVELVSSKLGLTPRKELKRDETELFSEQRIPANTYFLMDVECHDADLIFRVHGWLASQTLYIGRNKAPVAALTVTSAMALLEQNDNDTALTITVGSDWIVRSKNLGYLTRLEKDELLALFGINKNDQNNYGHLKLHAIQETETQGSFNYASGLPRRPFHVIRRGSSYRFTGDTTQLKKLNELLSKHSRPIGERTTEGYGQYCINLPLTILNRKEDQKPKLDEKCEDDEYENDGIEINDTAECKENIATMSTQAESTISTETSINTEEIKKDVEAYLRTYREKTQNSPPSRIQFESLIQGLPKPGSPETADIVTLREYVNELWTNKDFNYFYKDQKTNNLLTRLDKIKVPGRMLLDMEKIHCFLHLMTEMLFGEEA